MACSSICAHPRLINEFNPVTEDLFGYSLFIFTYLDFFDVPPIDAMENLRDQDFKAKITKTWNKGIYDRDTLKALETELMNRVAKTEDQDETDKWDNYLGLVMAMGKCLTCRESALHLYSKLDAPPEKNNEDQDRDNQGEQNNPPIRDVTSEAKNRTIYGLLEGEARSTWTEAICSGETIEQCWKRLKDVFENPTRINAFIQKKILDMKFVKDKFDTFALEKILSQLIELNSTLESLDGDYLGRSSSVLWQIADLFWVQESERIPLLNEFENCIRNRLHYHTGKKRHDPSQSKPKVSEVRAISPVQATPMNNFVARVKKCFLCENEGHKAVYCRSTMSADDKKKRINEQRLCLYCLWPGHASIACRRMNQIKCNSCQGNHPTSLHGIADDGKLISVQAVNFISIDTDEKIDLFEGFIGKTNVKKNIVFGTQCLGKINLETMRMVNEVRIDPVETKELEVEDVEEPNFDVKKLESGRCQVKLPFFSDIRPPNNYGKILNQLKKLQVR
ncbi:hypothetical protein BLOT_009835 [Blomia tropicalis]|nr:hypothetical protein BLOT_009835 [Blomia tropicalis]